MDKKSEEETDDGGVISNSGPVKTGEDREAKASGLDQKLMDFAEDLGTLLGTAEKKAAEWMSQRQSIEAQLIQIRDTTSSLLKKLAAGGTDVVAAVERGRQRGRSQEKGSKGQEKDTADD